MMSMENIQKIDAFLNKTAVCFFSTVEGERPRTRPIGFHLLRGDKIYFIISNHKDVYRQLLVNPRVEIVACDDQTWMRYFGEAVFETSDSAITAMIEAVPTLREQYGADAKEKLAILHLKNAVCEFKKMTKLIDRFECNVEPGARTERLAYRLQMTHPEVLQKMIADGVFEVWFQPQYDLKMRVLCGAEALIRLRGAEGTIVTPDAFLPELEEARVIDHLDFFVFDHICRRAEKWTNENRASVIVSSNFSRHTMATEHFVEKLIQIADRHRVPHRLLAIEVTETAQVADRQLFLRTLHRLQEEHFRVAIDDFGVMGANIRLLTETGFDMVKVDKSVIDTIHLRKESRLLTSALITACHQLGAAVLAEGVETEDQVQALLDVKCDAVQGYLFGRPEPESAFEKRLTGKVLSR